jgi:integrase
MQLLWWKAQFGKYFLCHITPSMISEKQDLLSSGITSKGTPRSSSTTNRYMAALSSAYSTCVREWQWVKENPVLKIKKLRENKGRERYLETHEITRLLNACKNSKSPHLYAITLFALCSGARKGELLGIKHKNLDLKRRTATFEGTKNGETRTVHLSDAVVQCLTKEISSRRTFSEYVFPSQDGTKPADIRGGWESALKEAGLEDICFHTLRHTAASHLAMKGLSLSLIGKILGHKSHSQTNRYSHLSTLSTAPALDQLTDEFLGAFASG